MIRTKNYSSRDGNKPGDIVPTPRQRIMKRSWPPTSIRKHLKSSVGRPRSSTVDPIRSPKSRRHNKSLTATLEGSPRWPLQGNLACASSPIDQRRNGLLLGQRHYRYQLRLLTIGWCTTELYCTITNSWHISTDNAKKKKKKIILPHW